MLSRRITVRVVLRCLVTTMADALFSSDLLEALPDAIVAVDRDGIIVQVNSQAQELFGYFREELIGQKVEILVPEAYRAQHHHHRQDFRRNPENAADGCRPGSVRQTA